jgi:UDPglucose 6-dehydrogenase
MNIGVIGTGYVGLVTGACLAEFGHEITMMDIDERKIEVLKKFKSHIYEPGIEELIAKNKERINFTTRLEDAVKDVIFLCLPTPDDGNGEADLSYVFDVAKKLAKMVKNSLIVVKSTVPVGTCERLKKIIPHAEIVSNPEFLREGTAIHDFMNPDRIVIGVESESAKKIMEKVYEKQKNKIIFMDLKSAEMVKYASNAFLALKISFINEIARLCEVTGANINNVKIGVGSDKRISPHFLNAGIGWGGSCFPKDVNALIKMGKKHGIEMKIVKAAKEVNYEQREILIEKMKKHYKKLEGKSFGILGLSFKPNTDDIREAPSIDVIKSLIQLGAKVKVYDPVAMENIRKIFGNRIDYTKDAYEAAERCDGLIVLTEWDDFKQIDFERLGKTMKERVVFDCRNFLHPPSGFVYYGFGV